MNTHPTVKDNSHRSYKSYTTYTTAPPRFPLSAFRAQRASSLVSTLLVLVILSTIVIAFMQSMSIERMTARSTSGILRSELAADAATQVAIGKLLATDSFPVSAYQEYSVAGETAPYLTMVKPNAAWDNAAETAIMASFVAAPADATVVETIDINSILTTSDASGWIGLTNASNARRKVPVQWIYIKNHDGIVVARYAYWIDDESARLDISQIGTNADTHIHKTGGTGEDISIHNIFSSGTDVKKFLDNRDTLREFCYGLLGYTQLVHTSGAQWKNSDYDKLRASIAWETKADERGAQGFRRLDINDWATGTDKDGKRRNDYSTPAARQRLADKVVALGDYINAADPTFASRFYLNTTDTDRRHYCIKLAANIQDYIDADSQPTVIRHDLGGWQEPPEPTEIGEGTPDLPPAAFGKEAVPAIGEYVAYYYNDAGKLRVDHTFEVWNIHTKAIDFSKLGNIKVLLAERNQVTPHTGSNAPTPNMLGAPGNPPLALDLPSATIPAGTYSLLTTLPAGQLGGAAADLNSQWVSNSSVPRIRIGPRETTYEYGNTGLRMEGDTLASNADVDTEILVANEYGYLDIQPRIAQQGAIVFNPPGSNYGDRVVSTQSFGNNPASSGNNTDRRYPLDSGDPRSFTEVFPQYSESGGNPSVIAWRRNTANAGATTFLGIESLNILPANTGISTHHVPEPIRAANINSGNDAVSVIRDEKMKTIGEFGFIYDPAIPGVGYENSNVRKRGGWRTLTIGSKMGEEEGPNRLAQVNETNRASRLIELFDVLPADPDDHTKFPKIPPPRVLLNSALRNPGNLPLRAVVDKFNMQTATAKFGDTEDFASPHDPQANFAGATISINNFITALTTDARTTNPGKPFFYLGQLARLPILNTNTELIGVTISSNAANKFLLDRGREEAFRRLVGSLCLKGSRFRIYAIGQSGQMVNDKFVPRATSRLVTLIEIHHEYADDEDDGTLGDPLDDTSKDKLLENNKPEGVKSKTILQLRY